MIRTLPRKASLLLFAASVLAGAASSAAAQTTTPTTPLERQLSKIDFGLGGAGSFNSQVSGTVTPGGPNQGFALTEKASNTVGVFGQVRYTATPWVGIEFNATQARFTENFNYPPGPQVQTTANEFSFGYFVTPKVNFFGLQPFASLDAGSTRFRPTRGGGQGNPIQWRATYAYNVGVQTEFGQSHFGARLAFREAFFKAPDFLLNYYTINQHTTSIEPNFLFYVRF